MKDVLTAYKDIRKKGHIPLRSSKTRQSNTATGAQRGWGIPILADTQTELDKALNNISKTSPDLSRGWYPMTSRASFEPNPFCNFIFLRRAVLAPLVGGAFHCYLWLQPACWRWSLWRLPQVVVLLSGTHTSVGVMGFCPKETFLAWFFYALSQSVFENPPSWAKDKRGELHDPGAQSTLTSNSDCLCGVGVVNVTEIFKRWVILGYFYGKIVISPDFQLIEEFEFFQMLKAGLLKIPNLPKNQWPLWEILL